MSIRKSSSLYHPRIAFIHRPLGAKGPTQVVFRPGLNGRDDQERGQGASEEAPDQKLSVAVSSSIRMISTRALVTS